MSWHQSCESVGMEVMPQPTKKSRVVWQKIANAMTDTGFVVRTPAEVKRKKRKMVFIG